MDNQSFDSLLPHEMAKKAEEIGVKKANQSFTKTFTLSLLAGAYIAIGGFFSSTVLVGSEAIPYGISKMLAGFAFCTGLILVVVGGAELFTGNNLIAMAWANKKITFSKLLRNWAIVYFGNFVGSVIIAATIFLGGQYLFSGGQVGLWALKIAEGKFALQPSQMFFLGILCNVLVCLAVWLTYSAKTTTCKIMAIIFPITAFVAAGFEHSVANMYFGTIAILIKNFAGQSFWSSIGKTAQDFSHLSPGAMANNLLWVTLGNIVGGALFVGISYWFIYLREKTK